ncbi:oligosaccharide flippase family protein [Hymenobacter sp. BT188]|uniref:oligosaccharide flippase family protein n=1 Tax=Hymenobacter sp. BT188 TaxID=2763504 RepID=UPI001651A9AE|nr:oligosaccharide flippase family protein [Hymenobacter sp. BT188]MBC6607476.1 oligosaccharide flippase family protein [Hymenobacter sp. BT188]
MSQNLSSRILHSIKWTTTATFAIAAMQVGYSALMSRLLTPADFGLVGMAGVVLSFGSYFAQMGLEQALIQRTELSDDDVRVAFTVSVLLGITCTTILWFAAPIVPLYFKNPHVVPILQVMAVSLLITGLSATAVSLLKRRMAFETLSKIEVASYIISYGGVGLGMAFRGHGVWSLLGATITQGILLGILAYWNVRHSIRPLFSWSVFKPLFAFGGKVSVISFLEFLGANLDQLFIGRLLGVRMVGIYNRAFMLVYLPVHNMTTSIARVLLPAFSTLQNDRKQLCQSYLTTLSLTSYVVLPTCVGIATTAEPLVKVMLGDQWLEAIPIVKIVAFVVGLNMLSTFGGILFESLADLNFKLGLQGSYVVVQALLMIYASRFGLIGLTGAMLVGEVLRHIAYLVAGRRLLSYSFFDIVSTYLPAVVTALVVGSVSYGLTVVFTGSGVPALVQLLAHILLCGFLLIGMLTVSINRPIRMQLDEHVLSKLSFLRHARPFSQMRLTVAKVRVRLAQIIQRKLLGSMVGNLPGTALRSLEEVWGWEAVKPHVRTMRTLSAPTTQYYNFPEHYPPYFRRYKAFEARLAYWLCDVCVAPDNGLTWLPNADYVLSESIGDVRRLMGWGNVMPHLHLLHSRRPTQLAEAGLVVAAAPSPFFHWLFETLPNLLTALELAPEVRILIPTQYPAFVHQALELRLGSSFNQRIIIADEPVRIPNLLLLQTEVDAGFVPPIAVEILRATYIPNYEQLPSGYRDIYISRRYAPRRAMVNEVELENALRERGFEIVYCEKLSFAEQIHLFSQARTVVALHGAGLSNITWAPKGLRVLEVFPNGYFNDCYARLAIQLGFAYSYATCGQVQGRTASGTISVADVVARLPNAPQAIGLAPVLQ